MTDTPPITPALTAEEWEHKETSSGVRDTLYAYIHPESAVLRLGWNDTPLLPVPSSGRHAIAALCLHEQPFGFTQEDVDILRGNIDTHPGADVYHGKGHLCCDPEEVQRRRESIAVRLAALLPPTS